jgi:glucokinase
VTNVCAVDVGGTAVKSGVLDASGALHAASLTDTPRVHDSSGQAVIDHVCSIVSKRAEQGAIDAVGLVVPGIVDEERGVGVHSENLGWRDVPFRVEVERRTGLPVAFGHDVRAGGLAESRLGAARDHSDVLFVPIGTGIAAALVLGGAPYAAHGWAGEIGHVDVGHAERCVCGLTGCLEAIASGAAIARRYVSRTGRVLSAAEVAERAQSGDEDAEAVWSDALDGLAMALAWTVGLVAPEVVVLGGGVATAGEDRLLRPLRERLTARLSFHRRPELVAATLGDEAGCIGAGLLGLDLIGARVEGRLP